MSEVKEQKIIKRETKEERIEREKQALLARIASSSLSSGL
jgi:hypothetical protein